MSKKNSCIRCIHKEACSALRSAAGNLQDYHKDCKHFKDIDLFEEKTPAEAEAEKLFDLQCEARSILES